MIYENNNVNIKISAIAIAKSLRFIEPFGDRMKHKLSFFSFFRIKASNSYKSTTEIKTKNHIKSVSYQF